jgi:NodT family efflux transporter outer membrane factor (OMF) lipoprotein
MKSHVRLSWLSVLLLLPLGSGCVMFKPDLRRPQEEALGLLPETYSVIATNPSPSQVWWQDFNSADLDRLIGLALTQNFSVVQAEARMRQAEAQAIKAGAVLWPELSVQGSASSTRQYTDSPVNPEAGKTTSTESYSLGGVAASYELDLWGRVRASRDSARSTYQASRSDLEAAWMSIAAQIADRWLQLQANQTKLELLRKQLETNRTLVDLLELRNRSGQATALDVVQQRQTAAATESAIPPLESAIVVLTNQLNILLGQPYATPLELADSGVPDLPPLPDAGLPGDLLTNRPDVQAAALRLESAGWSLASAKADRLPAIRLSGSAVYQSDAFADLFDNWLANLAAGFTAPVFDGGRRRAEVRRNEAVRDERLSAYKEAVLQAITDVENALIREDRQQAYLDSLQRERDYAKNALQEAQTRYRNGSIDYLNVLASLTSVQRLEQDMISGKLALLQERIGLYRALGGTWTRLPLNQQKDSP